MKAVVLAVAFCVAGAMAVEYNYTPSKAGSWVPPEPPAKESPHLGGRVPVPEASSGRIGRKLLQDAAAAGATATGGVVPHNWFGTGKYKAPAYSVATGKQECDVCKAMIANGADTVEGDAATQTPAASGPPAAKKNLCVGVAAKFQEMCAAYQTYMESCPSFVHNICHEDLGGSERLRSPCPDHLKCYYCLRINPLYCLTE